MKKLNRSGIWLSVGCVLGLLISSQSAFGEGYYSSYTPSQAQKTLSTATDDISKIGASKEKGKGGLQEAFKKRDEAIKKVIENGATSREEVKDLKELRDLTDKLEKTKLEWALPDLIKATKENTRDRKFKEAKDSLGNLNRKPPQTAPVDFGGNFKKACSQGGVVESFTQGSQLQKDMAKPAAFLKGELSNIVDKEDKKAKKKDKEKLAKLFDMFEKLAKDSPDLYGKDDIAKLSARKDISPEARKKYRDDAKAKAKKGIQDYRIKTVKSLAKLLEDTDNEGEAEAKVAQKMGEFVDSFTSFAQVAQNTLLKGIRQLKANCEFLKNDRLSMSVGSDMQRAYAYASVVRPDIANAVFGAASARVSNISCDAGSEAKIVQMFNTVTSKAEEARNIGDPRLAITKGVELMDTLATTMQVEKPAEADACTALATEAEKMEKWIGAIASQSGLPTGGVGGAPTGAPGGAPGAAPGRPGTAQPPAGGPSTHGGGRRG